MSAARKTRTASDWAADLTEEETAPTPTRQRARAAAPAAVPAAAPAPAPAPVAPAAARTPGTYRLTAEAHALLEWAVYNAKVVEGRKLTKEFAVDEAVRAYFGPLKAAAEGK